MNVTASSSRRIPSAQNRNIVITANYALVTCPLKGCLVLGGTQIQTEKQDFAISHAPWYALQA